MRVPELRERIKQLNPPLDSYSLDGGLPNERLCLSRDTQSWSIYYSEKGIRTEVQSYDSEEAACSAFMGRLCRMFGKDPPA